MTWVRRTSQLRDCPCGPTPGWACIFSIFPRTPPPSTRWHQDPQKIPSGRVESAPPGLTAGAHLLQEPGHLSRCGQAAQLTCWEEYSRLQGWPGPPPFPIMALRCPPQHYMESEGFIFPICVYFIIKKKLRSSNRGPERGGKGIHTFSPVKNRNKSFLAPSLDGALTLFTAGHYLDHPPGSWERQRWWLGL